MITTEEVRLIIDYVEATRRLVNYDSMQNANEQVIARQALEAVAKEDHSGGE